MPDSFSLSRILRHARKYVRNFQDFISSFADWNLLFYQRKHTHTRARHTRRRNGNIVQRIIFISYYNLNRTERDEIYNTDTNISLIISKCKIFVESWFLTNNSFMMLKKKFCFYSIVNIFFFFIENLLFKI